MGVNTAIINQARQILDNAPIPIKGRLIWHDGQMHRVCNKCGEEKPITEYYPHKRTPTGYLLRCKVCVRKQIYDRRSGTVERQRIYDRRRRDRQAYLKDVRFTLPKDWYPRKCGHYNPKDKVLWTPEDLSNVYDLWVAVINGARTGYKGIGEKNIQPNPDFFTQKDGIYAWLCDHMGVTI